MQKIFFEKWIDLDHQLKELVSLSVDESINYKIESVGVRAIGSLIVKGEYNDNQKFDENIDLDILATFDKIVDQRDFNIKVEDFDYTIKNGDVKIKIEVGIHGVVDGEDRYVKDEKEESELLVDDKDPLEEIEDLMRDDVIEVNNEDLLESSNDQEVLNGPVVEKLAPATTVENDDSLITSNEKAVEQEINEQLQEKVYPSKSRPIFQDVEDSVGTYYLYIVKDTDSYSDVATRYNIDEEIIRNYNQNKELEAGNVLIVPYVP